jgi:hypothetical protein
MGVTGLFGAVQSAGAAEMKTARVKQLFNKILLATCASLSYLTCFGERVPLKKRTGIHFRVDGVDGTPIVSDEPRKLLPLRTCAVGAPHKQVVERNGDRITVMVVQQEKADICAVPGVAVSESA